MMANQRLTINSRKFDLSVSRTWTGELIEKDDTRLVVLGKFDADIVHPELGRICEGTLSYEYYWLGRWFNIFRFHEPDGSFRNYYCNITMPPVLSVDTLDYVDLDIDIVVWPGSGYEILDRSEFAENAAKYQYPEEILSNVDDALSKLLKMIKENGLPKG